MKLVLDPAWRVRRWVPRPRKFSWALAEGQRQNPTDKWYFDRVPTEAPRHHVKITKPFYLGMYQVTQAEYEKVMGVNPSAFTEKQMEASAFKPPLDEKRGRSSGRSDREEGGGQRHQPSPGGNGQLGRGDGVLPQTFGDARRAGGAAGLSAADRSGVGVCLPGRNDDALVLAATTRRAWLMWRGSTRTQADDAPGGREEAERLGPV